MKSTRRSTILRCPQACALLLCMLVSITRGPAAAQPSLVVDLLQTDPAVDSFERIHGSAGDGTYGVPVAGPFDCDGDGLRDVALRPSWAPPSIASYRRGLSSAARSGPSIRPGSHPTSSRSPVCSRRKPPAARSGWTTSPVTVSAI
jgi:hypothetical protein